LVLWALSLSGETAMKINNLVISVATTLSLAIVATGVAISAQDRYTVKVPGGLAFSEFKGYETWQTIAISKSETAMAVILGNPAMIAAYKAGIPGNGKPFPDGARMAKIHWVPKKNELAPGTPLVPGNLHDIDFMVKDAKRFADSGGWGYGAFEYDAASKTFRPGNASDMPPQAQDAKCGFGCHTIVQNRDYVFTDFPER
jgi:hypothetical protein